MLANLANASQDITLLETRIAALESFAANPGPTSPELSSAEEQAAPVAASTATATASPVAASISEHAAVARTASSTFFAALSEDVVPSTEASTATSTEMEARTATSNQALAESGTQTRIDHAEPPSLASSERSSLRATAAAPFGFAGAAAQKLWATLATPKFQSDIHALTTSSTENPIVSLTDADGRSPEEILAASAKRQLYRNLAAVTVPLAALAMVLLVLAVPRAAEVPAPEKTPVEAVVEEGQQSALTPPSSDTAVEALAPVVGLPPALIVEEEPSQLSPLVPPALRPPLQTKEGRAQAAQPPKKTASVSASTRAKDGNKDGKKTR
jgi:hypothetical protein